MADQTWLMKNEKMVKIDWYLQKLVYTVSGQIIILILLLLIATNLLLLTIHILKLFPKNNMKDFKIMHKTTLR